MDTSNLQQIKQRFNIIGNSEGLNRALDIAVQVAPTDLSVLIIGESGVGKEVIPQIIHQNSIRKHGKYFAINCGSIPEGTIDSELFGHSKGAFTGAVGEREGYFGAADGGTIFLDEVGELPLATQARLLRVLETGEYIRVGENVVKKTNVRIVAATNVNMQKAIREGKFREDLYYRLNTIPVTLPPLRERGNDIEFLFRYFVKVTCEKYRREPVRLTTDGRKLLMAYKWPGNIRQLRNICEQICIISREREITADELSLYGITDDSKPGGIIHNGTIKNVGGSDTEFDYIKDRENILKLIGQLSLEVKNLKEFVYGQHVQHLQLPHHTSDGYHIDMPTHTGTGISQDDFQDTVIIEDELQEKATSDQTTMTSENPINLQDVEKINIERALQTTHGNRRKAASLLGINERTIYRKIKEYGITFILCLLTLTTVTACTISYKFNGSSINYDKVHTISIDKFPIRSAYVWAPMEAMFYNSLTDVFAKKTKLTILKRNGDLQLSGEIVEYSQTNKSVSANGYSAQTQLKVTVNVRFVNQSNHKEDFEQKFSATADYDSSQQLVSVQEDLVQEIFDQIVDQVFNATVANW